MNATRKLHDLGQRLWLDNITRGLVTSGTLARYIKDFSVTGLTSNPTIFDHAISGGDFYDEAIRADAGDAEAVLAEFARAGVDNAALATRLQREGAAAFVKSWRDLLSKIASKVEVLPAVKQA